MSIYNTINRDVIASFVQFVFVAKLKLMLNAWKECFKSEMWRYIS